MSSRTRLGWPSCLATALLAAAVAMLLQNAIRDLWQIRTLPERVMEWLLLFVPLDLFEAGLGRLGADAKDVALIGVVVGMAALLAVIGVVALRVARSSWWLLALGGLLWLVAMVVVLPVTGAGPFGTQLLRSPVLTSAGYALVFLGYATVLVAGRLAFRALAPGPAARPTPRPSADAAPPDGRPVAGERPEATGQPPPATADASTAQTTPTADASPAPVAPARAAPVSADRRALLTGLVGGIVAFGVARVAAQSGGLAASSLPLATVPTPAVAPTATGAGTTPATAAEGEAAASRDTPAPAGGEAAAEGGAAATAATATPPAIPTPPPERQLARNQDGSLTAAGRPKGTLAPAITGNQDFYVVTKNAAGDPLVDPTTWRLAIEGEVQRPIQLDYPTLRALPSVTQTKTLECISNFTAQCNLTTFGCDLISTATWTGVPLRDLIDLAGGLKPGVQGFAILSVDEFSAGLPPEAAMDPNTLVVYDMNGEVLPREHGYPARLLVPGRYGMKNPKWLAAIRPMAREFAGWYEQRGWNKDAIIKTMGRIDTPVDGAVVQAGDVRVAGVAYAGDRGVDKVEISPDGGQTWQPTRFLEQPPAADVLVRWETSVALAPGDAVTLVVRVTDGTGEVQTDEFSLPQPDGGSGRDTIQVRAA
jgi:DMSO/TMAO reductase YedYZ molybdopterin-dependent catalytic subunit